MVIAIIILSLALIGVSIRLIVVSRREIEEIQVNEEVKEINQRLEQTRQSLEADITSKQNTLKEQNSILDNVQETLRQLQEEAKNRAEETYQVRLKEIEERISARKNELIEDYESQSASLVLKIDREKQKLKDLEDKQLAYIQAQKRQEEITAKQDYYRLVIDDLDLNDIKLLREIQSRFSKKDSIDKLIWEIYFKPAYDILTSHLFKDKSKVCGIYKMTDLITGQSYIGQSVDIRERWRQHIKTSLSYGNSSNKLYQAMQKSGQDNFTFEILEEIPRDKLNERETYWIEFYKTKEVGLNSTRGGS